MIPAQAWTEYAKQLEELRDKDQIEVSYVAFVHPDIVRHFRDMAARLKYKTQSHNERYRRRYGQYPKLYEAETGTLDSFRFITD